jgi:hypothetical protein
MDNFDRWKLDTPPRFEDKSILSGDPADFEGVMPQCEFCTDNVATRRCAVGGMLLCDECYQDWLNGRYDEPTPLAEPDKEETTDAR